MVHLVENSYYILYYNIDWDYLSDISIKLWSIHFT
jgi:hypothetical protein